MAAQPQAGALVKARIEGKQGTHRIRVRAVSDDGVSFVHEWTSKGRTVQGKKTYTLPLAAVEVLDVLDPRPEEDRADRFVIKPGDVEVSKAEEPAKAEEQPRRRPRRPRQKATTAA
jgi:hypothetical protein